MSPRLSSQQGQPPITPTRVAFIELSHTGHRLYFVKVLAEACAPESHPLLITTSEAVTSREFEVQLGDLARRGALQVEVVGSARQSLRQLVMRAIMLSTRRSVRRLVIPDADRLLVGLVWVRFRIRSGHLPELRFVVMRTPEPTLRFDRKVLVAAAKIGLTAAVGWAWAHSECFFLTDAFGVVTSRKGYRRACPLQDPSPGLPLVDALEAKKALGIPSTAFVLGLLGVVGASKHPDATFHALRLLPPTVVALVAGTQDAPTSVALVASRKELGEGRIVLVIGYLSDAEFGQCVSACDAMMLMYDDDAPSGMLASAVEAGVPIVAGRSPWVRRVVSALGAGLVSEPTAEGVAGAVKLLMRAHASPRHPRERQAARAGDFAEKLLNG